MSLDNDQVEVVSDADGNNVSFECGLAQKNPYEPVDIPYFYELSCVGESALSTDEAMRVVETQLVNGFATMYDIFPDDTGRANGCVSLPYFYGFEGRAWVLAVDGNPPDSELSDRSCAQSSTANCVLVQGKMAVTVSGSVEGTELQDTVSQLLNSNILQDCDTTYVGSILDPNTGQDPVVDPEIQDRNPPPVSAAQNGDNTVASPSKNLSATGGALVAAFVIAFAAFFTIMVRRRRRYEKNADIGLAVTKSDLEFGNSADDYDERNISVLSDGHQFNTTTSSVYTSDSQVDSPSSGASSSYYPNSYSFDLGHSWKNEVMGTYAAETYGPTSIQVVPPYPMEGESTVDDSDADSWAQPDGTVGSLEENLEPITAEI